jgi:NTP pyrophosphatase (non-canonical NTP hydrolase)
MNPLDLEFLTTCEEITREYEKLWGRRNIDSQLLHIVTEIAEVKDVLRNKNDKYGEFDTIQWRKHLLDEMADVLLTFIPLKDILNITHEEINKAIRTKLQIIQLKLKEQTIVPGFNK